MALNCGIVGLPNVGKSTLFSALTAAPAEAANYPFCTINPNFGIVDVPDPRLYKIAEFIPPQKLIPTTVEFVDIAGLVRGASKGEGLGNQFLGNIRQVGAIVHVVRCFDDDNIVHVEGSIDPARDIETIEIELALADLESVQKRIDGLGKMLRSNDKKTVEKAKTAEPVLHLLTENLDKGIPARNLNLEEEQIESIKDLNLITLKKQIYCCNVDENSLDGDNEYVSKVKAIAEKNGSDVIVICGKLESEISELETKEEKRDFLAAVGLEESGLDQMIKAAYHSLDLQTYFTAGEKEVRAWTFKRGYTAPQAAGIIHTDFERGFIRAEVYHCNDLFALGSEAKIKDAGKLRIEGRDYIVKDGDVMHFRFNV
ncbi:MAG: redox-regulated ATPase YchF [Candidatus Kapabacteria bacterium]|nr:redox-regulated ATPase YchF [Ignavibacteriota bacterium]MCW5885420.1 redox-regulated ATPase YchF [Candidatus Kapabacteria bacterium]